MDVILATARDLNGEVILNSDVFMDTIKKNMKKLGYFSIAKNLKHSIGTDVREHCSNTLYFRKTHRKNAIDYFEQISAGHFRLRAEHLLNGADKKRKFTNTEKDEIKRDIDTAQKDSKSLPKNERYSYVRQRVGQSIFRDNLYNHWQGCSVTGYKDKKMLIASHIIPYRDTNDESAYDLHNGLLLTPNLDKAFDRGYISFDDDGKIIISKDFKKYEQFGITLGMKLIEISDEQRRYLKCHREETLI